MRSDDGRFRGYGRWHIPGSDFAGSLELMVEDLFAVADAAGLPRFHLTSRSSAWKPGAVSSTFREFVSSGLMAGAVKD